MIALTRSFFLPAFQVMLAKRKILSGQLFFFGQLRKDYEKGSLVFDTSSLLVLCRFRSLSLLLSVTRASLHTDLVDLLRTAFKTLVTTPQAPLF